MAGADLIIRPPRLHFLIRLRRAFKHLSHDVVAALINLEAGFQFRL